MRVAILIAAGVVLLAGCGGDDDAAPRRPDPPVRLEITSPRDLAVVRRGTVDVRGRVSPSAADVRVMGRPALVSEGSFTVVVPLEPGANVVDVAATARGRRPSLTAFRVRREERVVVPDLSDVDVDEIESTLRAIGLRVELERGGGLLDRFIPSPVAVCEQDPSAAERVTRGTTVRVVVARSC